VLAGRRFLAEGEAGGKGLRWALFLKVGRTGIEVSRGGIEIVDIQWTIGDTTRGGEGGLLTGTGGGKGDKEGMI